MAFPKILCHVNVNSLCVLASTELNQDCLSDNGFGAIHYSLADSGAGAPLKTMTPPLPESICSL